MIDIKAKVEQCSEKFQELITEYRKEAAIIISALIFLLLSVLVILLVFAYKSNSANLESKINQEKNILTNSDMDLSAINIDALEIIEEPLKLPPIQFSREQRKIWESDEIKYWYEPPSEKDIEALHNKNKKLIESILEAAP